MFFEQLPVRAWVAALRASLQLYFWVYIPGEDFCPSVLFPLTKDKVEQFKSLLRAKRNRLMNRKLSRNSYLFSRSPYLCTQLKTVQRIYSFFHFPSVVSHGVSPLFLSLLSLLLASGAVEWAGILQWDNLICSLLSTSWAVTGMHCISWAHRWWKRSWPQMYRVPVCVRGCVQGSASGWKSSLQVNTEG